ncbi:uncharacterized protein LOC131079457 [Cryptomeria japonica]|uniref:uncharacterized protein LOC131079457 n=1 Tax=Cryptomeria japonica TaxID=3369 RepID=UPI0027DAB299|nr:uncharacterized protein LOC131079457 [Cryptomeria japonica]
MEWSRSGNGGRVSAEDTVGGEDSDEEEVFLLDMWREAQMAPGSGSDGLSHALRKGFLFPAMSLPHVVASGVSGANLGALQSKSLGASPLSCSIVEDGAAVVVAGVAAVPDDDMDIWSHDCSGDRSGTIDGKKEDELLLSPVVGSSPKTAAAVSVPETSLCNGF